MVVTPPALALAPAPAPAQSVRAVTYTQTGHNRMTLLPFTAATSKGRNATCDTAHNFPSFLTCNSLPFIRHNCPLFVTTTTVNGRLTCRQHRRPISATAVYGASNPVPALSMKTSNGSGGTSPLIVMVSFIFLQFYFPINSPGVAIK